jgi:hypothetical protein
MRPHIRLFPVIVAVLLVVPRPALPFDGPLQVRNQFPLFLPINPPYLESAALRNFFSLGLSHSSVFVIADAAAWSVHMDLELTEMDLRVAHVLSRRYAVGIEVPVLRPSGGFFDRPLDDYHDFLKWGDYGRSVRPMNGFLYEITRGGAPVITGENDRAAAGDVRLTVKRALRESGPAVSMQANIELPTGDPERGYGSGGVDTSLAVLADVRIGERSAAFVNIGAGFPGDLKARQTVDLRPYAFAGTGLEAAWWSRFSVIAQTLVQTSPFPRTGIKQIDRPGLLLTIGGRYSFTGSCLEFSLTEDPNTTAAPDFTANVTFTQKF